MQKILKLEQITKGFANKRRIEIMQLLYKQPSLDVEVISESIQLGYKAVSEHLRKMYIAELIEKEYEGYYVLHKLTARGKLVYSFLRKLR